tara:strand:+ start:966 stop:1541 length:576 start_codon:yes stop_codon:yes gene_type:complete
MGLKEMIDDNMAVLEAESKHQEMLAEEKLQRQREVLIELGDEIKPAVEEAGYSFGRFKGNDILKRRSYQQKRYSDEKEIFINIQFEDSRHLKNTGESESFYAPQTRYAGQHCGSNEPAYIKIRWDDDRGVYHIIPNVAYNWNEEIEGLDPLTYQELTGTKEMVIERLAIVLANAMRYEKSMEDNLRRENNE